MIKNECQSLCSALFWGNDKLTIQLDPFKVDIISIFHSHHQKKKHIIQKANGLS